MILYSIIPPEIVFSSDNDQQQAYIELEHRGQTVIAVPLSNSTYKIERVISTSPKAYLDPALQPGMLIKA